MSDLTMGEEKNKIVYSKQERESLRRATPAPADHSSESWCRECTELARMLAFLASVGFTNLVILIPHSHSFL